MVEQRLTFQEVVDLGEARTFSVHTTSDENLNPIWERVTLNKATDESLIFNVVEGEGRFVIKKQEVFSRVRLAE